VAAESRGTGTGELLMKTATGLWAGSSVTGSAAVSSSGLAARGGQPRYSAISRGGSAARPPGLPPGGVIKGRAHFRSCLLDCVLAVGQPDRQRAYQVRVGALKGDVVQERPEERAFPVPGSPKMRVAPPVRSRKLSSQLRASWNSAL
jgi:hypothetical protein